MGVRDWISVAGAVAAILVGAACSYGISRSERRPMPLLIGMMVCSACLVGLVSRLFGPLVGAPTLALGVATAGALHPTGGKPWQAMLTGMTGIAVPLALEWLGVLDPSYAFTAEGILIRPHMASFPAGPALGYLALSALLTIGAIALYLGRLRGGLEGAQRQLHVHAWQLRQILPQRLGEGR
jgi:hypothetical protein